MKAIEHTHPVPSEELMAYLDGELSPEGSTAVHAHLAQCVACQHLAADLRQVSRDLASWQVEQPSMPLEAPANAAVKVSVWRPSVSWLRSPLAWRLTAAAALVVIFAGMLFALLGTQVLFSPSFRVAPPASRASARADAQVSGRAGSARESSSLRVAAATPEPRATQPSTVREPTPVHQPFSTLGPPVRGPKIIRTVNMTIVAKAFDDVRPAIDRMLREVNGFVGQMQASDAGSPQRSLRATLRVPASRLDEAVRILRPLGHVVDESQSGDDVTEQVHDLEARLVNSRNTERRLTDVLNNRTGRLGDVLEVEREIARVREEIERMDAQRLNLERRVTYATLTLQVTEQHQATLDLGPLPVSTRLRNASVDGVRDAYESAVDTVLWVLRVVPILALWTVLLWWPVRAIIRAIRARVVQAEPGRA